MESLDVATTLDILVPSGKYTGSLTSNNESCYNNLNWQDERNKPTWSEICSCMNKPCETATWTGSEWYVDYVSHKTKRKQELADDCHEAITLSPFTSSALGSLHSYDCRETDQLNARAAYILAKDTSTSKEIMCNDGSRFESRLHTESQALQVLSDMFDHILEKRTLLSQKQGAVDAIDPETYDTPQDVLDAINNIDL